MIRFRRIVLSLAVTVCIFFSSLAIYVGLVEYKATKVDLEDTFGLFELWREEILPVSYSSRSVKEVSQSCIKAMNSVLLQIETQENQDKVFANCFSYSQKNVLSGFVLSEAHLVIALYQIRIGDIEAAIEALKKAQKLAPFEAWLVRQRIKALLAIEHSQSIEVNALLKLEYYALLQSKKGMYWAVKLYKDDIKIRELFSDVNREITPDQRADFLRLLRSDLN